ncbi:MAG: SDR family oxidoreductase [Deltaproteobacteria bacterium]|nr:SDR family oxidoreductase [Deltaproteobacteria bacterium]
MELRDRVVFITGASNGIGRQLAIDLAVRGAIVVGCGRVRERLVETLKEVRKVSPKSLMIACDIGDAEQVHDMMSKVHADFDGVDILINNAGIGMRRPFVDTPLETIEAILRTNFLGAVYCTHEVLPAMIARGSGHIVNISSGAGKIGTLNMAGYCASKFAVNGWSESLYHELKPLGVNVSVICPGPVTTDFNREFRDSEPKSPPALFVGVEAVSAQVLRAIEKNKFEVVMPRWLALLCAVKAVAPGTFRFFAQRRFRVHVTAPALKSVSPDFPGN